MEMILPWIVDFEEFKWAYAVVMSRGMSLRLNEYYILDQITERRKKFTKWENKNLELNQKIGLNVGVPCVIAYIDLCNHYQPNYVDLRDKKPIVLDTLPNYFFNTIITKFDYDKEVTYTYTNMPDNINNFLHYGFVIQNNIFNLVQLTIEDNQIFSNKKFNLCKQLGCIDSTVKHPQNVNRQRKYYIRINKIDGDIMNYARVKYLNEDFDQKVILKTILNEKPISFINEVSAWLFYYSNLIRVMSSEKISVKKSIVKAQEHRNALLEKESNWENNANFAKKEWVRQKNFENLFLFDVSFKKIMFVHLKGCLNNLILHANNELSNLKAQYLK